MPLYFPDKYAKGRTCDREYLFNVANTLHKAVVEEVIAHSMNQRFSISEEKQKDESILISDEWA